MSPLCDDYRDCHDQVKPKTMNLVFAASPLRSKNKAWLAHNLEYVPSGLPVDCCFSELALKYPISMLV